jgi:hypothetical protein
MLIITLKLKMWLGSLEDPSIFSYLPFKVGGNAEFGQNSTLRLKAASCIACKEVS